MAEKMNRRMFLKGTAAVVAAASLSGLFAGCSDGGIPDKFADAQGLNNYADLDGIRMCVKSVGVYTDSTTREFWFIPKIEIQNNGTFSVQVMPRGGSFKVLLDGKTELDLNDETMSMIEDDSELPPIPTQTLPRTRSTSGCICAGGSGRKIYNYVQVVYYPMAEDKSVYLRCNITAAECNVLLGV